MKKLFAILLAAAMTATLSVPAFASTIDQDVPAGTVANNSSTDEGSKTLAEALTDTPAQSKGEGDYSIGVSGTYQTSSTTAKDVISVDIAWAGLHFTYADRVVYDPNAHEDVHKGEWSNNKGSITVKNHSNVEIDAKIAYKSTDSNVHGYFYEAEAAQTGKTGEQTITLESAEGKRRDDDNAQNDQTPTGTVYFGIGGAAIAKDDPNLGTITVKIAKPTWTDVSTASGLTSGGRLKLTENINVGTSYSAPSVTLENCSTIDLNGKKISGSNMQSLISVTADACAVQNGTLENTNTASTTAKVVWVPVANITLRLEQCTLTANSSCVALWISLGSSTVIAKDCTFNGNINNSGTLELSGNIELTGTISGSGTVKCLAGTYNFDPTDYVDAENYTVTEDSGTYTVTAKA